MSYYAFSALINGLISISLGVFIFTRNKKDIRYLTYSLFCVNVAAWSFFYFLWQIAPNGNTALFYCRALMMAAIFIPVTYLHYLFVFFKIYNRRKKIIQYGYIGGILFYILSFTPLFVKDVSPKLTFQFWPNPGVVFHPFLILWMSYVVYGVCIIISRYKNSKGYEKNQLRYVLLATFIGWFGGGTNYLLFYDILIPPFGNILVSGYMVILAIAILRYRLMDINIALTRAGIFLIVYTLVLGIPFWLGYRYGVWKLATWLTVLLASGGPFIYTFLRRQAEGVILREQRLYQQALRKLAESMLHIRQLDELLKTVTNVIVDTVKVGFAGVYLKNQQYGAYHLRSCCPDWQKGSFHEYLPLDYLLVKSLISQKRPILGEEVGVKDKPQKDFSLVVPFFVEEGGLIGFMVLGPKANNQMYTPDDVLAFETLSYSTSLAIENCIYWKEIEDRQRKARLQEMDAYSYSLAHEIDNPMQVILGQTQLLEKEFLKNVSAKRRKELNDSFGFITEAAKRVSGMVRAIRDFGSQVTGELKPIKAEDVVESFSRLYFPQFKANSVLFEKQIGIDLGYLRAEKPELMQVLVILANNALHAMKNSKEKKVTLKAERTIHHSVKITLSDTGHGVKKELLPIIFAPFTTTKASTEGTGMGLYNAKKIIDRHRGIIVVESEGEGKGATFIIELPTAKDVSKKELEKDETKSKRLI